MPNFLQNILKNSAPTEPQNVSTPSKLRNGAFEPLLERFGFGRKKTMYNDTAEVVIQKEEFYRGLGYGVIRKAINTGIVTAEENIRTTCSSTQREILAQRGDQIEHPYITLFRNSPFFSEYDFWKQFFLYIQLKGEFYIYVERKPIVGNERYRAKNLMTMPKYMKILNPYEMTINYDENGKVKNYTQKIKRGTANLERDIDPYKIIRVVEINPFDSEQPYSLLNATAENFFTLKNAQDFTRHAVANNINSPMMVSTGEFETEEGFQNFLARILNHEDGEPIVVSGSGEVKVQELTQNLDGASLEKINQLNRDEIFIATGASKSVLGVETTGLTRDVAATQKLTYVESTVVPMIKLLIEALNFDYRTNYPLSFAVDKYIMHITNPSTGDKAQELKELEVREQEYTLVEKYVARGYTRKSAAQFVRGEIDVEQLQLEDEKAKLTPQESTELVDSVERWQELISAGNDPKDVVDLAEGRMTLGEFLIRNKDAAPVQTTPTEPDAEQEPVNSEGTYYDPDSDYSTPRDLKKPKAKSKKQENYETAMRILSSYDCKITEKIVSPLIDPLLPQAQIKAAVSKVMQKVSSLYSEALKNKANEMLFLVEKNFGIKANSIDELGDLANLSSKQMQEIQDEANNLDYATINKKLNKLR